MRKIAPLILIGVLVALAIWYFNDTRAAEIISPLTASGTIEATQVTVSAELSGRVKEVLVAEGDQVQAGQVLLQLDEELLQAQITQAETQLALAKANYALIAAGTPVEQKEIAIKAAELEQLAAQQALDDLDKTAPLVEANLAQQIAELEKALDQATKRVDSLNTASAQADIDAARAQMILAKDQLDKANEAYSPYEKKPENNLVRASLLARLAEAQKRYDQTVQKFNNLSGHASDLDLSLAEANKTLVKAQLRDVERRHELAADGPDADAVALAEARLAAANASITAAKANPTSEQLAVAQAHIDAAEAALNLLKVQAVKYRLLAPIDGKVLSRSVQPGEVIVPAAPLLTLANLDELTITIFLPENRYGEVKIGDQAVVTIDSFPGEKFKARVVQIADQAEFTPRNVQTAEGRTTTVYAVKLVVDPAGGKLKPGMPADIRFDG
jgi:HlyD family secretion protein